MHLHKGVCEPLPRPICFTGQHPPSPVSRAPLVQRSQPQKGCVSWPRAWSSGGLLGKNLGTTGPPPGVRQEAFSSYLCQGITWHTPPSSFLGSPSGIRGSWAPQGGGGKCPWGQSLACSHASLTANPQALPSPLLHSLPPSTPEEPDTQFRASPRQHNAQLLMVTKYPQLYCSLSL